jgi:Protein of unknown function (DUF4242)
VPPTAAPVIEVRGATAEGDKMSDDVCWIRSYVTAETDGSLGTICIYQASGEEAIRGHAARADLPTDEIVEVADTVIGRPDPSYAGIS